MAGYPLKWMPFSTLDFLLCCLVQKDNKLFKIKLVCLFLLIKRHPKEKRGAATVYRRRRTNNKEEKDTSEERYKKLKYI